MLADMHVHSAFSVDAQDDLDTMCRTAIERKLSHICFTEHFDLDPRDIGYGYFRLDDFSRAIDLARARYGQRLKILKGLEFGEPHLFPREFAALAAADFDLILGSVHFIEGGFVGEAGLADRHTLREIFDQYYAGVLEAVRFGKFDVLAHLDFPKRYWGEFAYPEDTIGAILRQMVKAGIALEINTSPLRKGLGACAPDRAILARYEALGGRRITIGSDAHASSEIAAGFDYAEHLISRTKEAVVGVYEKRQFIPLADLGK